MGIPNKFNRLGTNTGILPRGYLAAEFLESTGEQYILTEIHPERLNARVKWQTFLQTGRLFCYDNNPQFYRAMQAVDNNKVYIGFDALVNGARFFLDTHVSAGSIVEGEINSDENFISNNGTIKRPSSGTIAVGYDANAKLTLFAATNKANKIKARLYAMKFWRASGAVADFAFAVDKNGIPCMFDTITRKPFYNDSGAGQFIVGMTIEQARNLGKLPVVETGTLTVSLPWEAQWDAGVQFALSLAMIKGWTIVVQYRDPEIATANIPISFLETSGTQTLTVDGIIDNDFGLYFDVIATNETAANNFALSMQTNEGGYKNIRIGSGTNAGLTWWTGGYVRVPEGGPVFNKRILWQANFKNNRLLTTDSEFGHAETTMNDISVVSDCLPLGKAAYVEGGIFKNWLNYPSYIKVYNAKTSRGTTVTRALLPVLDPSGAPCLYDRVTSQPFYNSGTGVFIAGFDTVLQSRNLAYLPDVTTETNSLKKSLTVSLPWESQWDAATQSALQVAANRGWTITVQYREPEVATQNISIDFLEGTGTQWVESNAYLSKLHDFDLEVADLSGSQAWGREDGGFVLSMGMQSYGLRFIYTNGGYKEVRLTNLSGRTLIQKRGNVFSMNGVSETADFSESTTVSTKPVRIFTYQGKAPYIAKGKWYRQTVYLNGETVQDARMALDASGVPCMHDSVSGENFYNSGSGAFIAGFESTEKAALGLARLPVVEAGELTVSLPWEAQLVSTVVPAALQVAANRGWTITVQYRDPEADNAYYNKYNACTTVTEVKAVNADYMNDLTAEGEWIYPLEKLKTATSVFNGAKDLKIWQLNLPAVTNINDGFRESGLTEFNATISASNISAILYGCNDLVQIELDAPNATVAMNAFGKSPARRIKVNLPMLQNGRLLCSGCSNLEDFDGTLPSVTDLTSAFSVCILNKASVLRITDSLQSFTDGTSHALNIGIHTDLQTDADVLAAIEATEAKGWTVTVQWNGTATAAAASTFGLRSPSIYAKLITLEYPDGSVESLLDWGHYVTNWEENGYQEFSSIEEAEEYFNINQIEEV